LNTPDASSDRCRAVFERLAATPRQLFELCSGADPARLSTPIAPGKWTPLQIIVHLIGCDREALLPRIEKMLAETDPFLAAYDQDRWMRMYGHVDDRKAVVLLDEYARIREKSVIMLFDLSPEEWQRGGRHEEWGPTTIYDLAVYFADHDDHHRAQLERHLKPATA
jgi:uncharacterized damage-inducible protein DinB